MDFQVDMKQVKLWKRAGDETFSHSNSMQFPSLVSSAVLAVLQSPLQSHTTERERERENNSLAGNRKRDQSCSNWSGSGLLGCASSFLVCPPSPSSGQLVQLRLASISPPHRPFLSVSVFLPDLRERPQRAGRLDVSTSLNYFSEVSLFV